MKQISNSTLALFVVLAIVVSVFGTLVSLSKLNQIDGISGMFSATASGKANLTVQSSAYINLTDDLIEFGTLDVAASNSSDHIDDWFRIRNDGSVNISVKVYDHASDPQSLSVLGDTAGMGPFSAAVAGGCMVTSPDVTCFLIKCNSTLSGFDCNNTYYSLPTGSGASGDFLIDLDNDDDIDDAVFGVNVTVPLAEGPGNKEQQITFEAVCSDTATNCGS